MGKVRAVLVVLLSAFATALPNAALAQRSVELALQPAGGPSGNVLATITDMDDLVTVTITASGLQPGASYELQTHAGTCEFPSASFGSLGSLTADEYGNANMTTTTARLSAAGVTVDLDILLDGLHTLDLHGPDVTACASVPALSADGLKDGWKGGL